MLADKRWRWPKAALASLLFAGGLSYLLALFAILAMWETVTFVKHWGYVVAATVFLGACVAVLAWLAFRHRRWWFLCIPSLLVWLLILVVVVWGRIDDGEGGFGFHCATVRRGETIDAFEQRMIAWAHTSPEYDVAGDLGVAVFEADSDTQFYVYFDEETRKIVSWCYASV